MAAMKILAGTLLFALAASSGDDATGDACGAYETRSGASALVVRASVPVAMGHGHGDGSFRLPLVGGSWRVKFAWSSGRGHTRAGVVVAQGGDDGET